ncbi:MAG: hypothetical protein ACD_54C00951G0001, partial [uncultured bacterium]
MQSVIDIAIAQRNLPPLQLVGHARIIGQIALGQRHLCPPRRKRFSVVMALQQRDFLNTGVQLARHR